MADGALRAADARILAQVSLPVSNTLSGTPGRRYSGRFRPLRGPYEWSALVDVPVLPVHLGRCLQVMIIHGACSPA